MCNNLNEAIGNHVAESADMDWLGYWPVVDESGIVTSLVEADNVPDGARYFDISGKKLVETTPNYGFDAVMID